MADANYADDKKRGNLAKETDSHSQSEKMSKRYSLSSSSASSLNSASFSPSLPLNHINSATSNQINFDSKGPSINLEENTEIWYGEEMAMNGLVKTMSRVREMAYIVGDSMSPSFSMGIDRIKNGYIDFKNRHVKIRFITEITKDNLSYCKELMNYTDLRHMEGVKGNLAISETEYVATAKLHGEAKPITQTIYSNVRAIIEQNRYFFENLWNIAIPASKKIKELEENIPPIQTKILQDPQEIQNKVKNLIEGTTKVLKNCSTYGGFKIIYSNEQLFGAYKNLLSRSGSEKNERRVKWITHIEDNPEQVELIEKFLKLGANIRHVNSLPPLHFALTEKEFHATINKIDKENTLDNILLSTEPIYIEHFNSVFEEIWKTGIDARQRISQIQKGIAYETTEIIENPRQTRKLFQRLIEEANEEISIIFPTHNSIARNNKIRIIDLLKQKSQNLASIRILAPSKDNVINLLNDKINLIERENNPPNSYFSPVLSPSKQLKPENIVVREIAKQQDIQSTILIVDKKYLLAIELKDDSNESFDKSVGLSTLSSSRPTVLSNLSIFESLWTEIELHDRLKSVYEKLEINDRMQRDFINMAAHELRTPSQAILGYAELATLDNNYNEKKDKKVEYIEKIVKNADRLERLIQNLLSVARIENNILKLHEEVFNLEELVIEISEEFKRKNEVLHSRNIEIQIEKNNTKQFNTVGQFNNNEKNITTTVKADREGIGQVVINLLQNALKFANKKILIRIRTEENKEKEKNIRKDQSSGKEFDKFIIVDIIDDGPGIDKDVLQNIFSKFNTKSDKGVGLGLYISKNIIEAHGGRIIAENKEKENGAIISFKIPVL